MVRVRQPADFNNQKEKMKLDEEISNYWSQGPSRIQNLINQSAWNRFDSDVDVDVIATKGRERRRSKAAEEISSCRRMTRSKETAEIAAWYKVEVETAQAGGIATITH